MEKRELCLSTEGDFEVVSYPLDVEKRENPVCHFATPLDGSMDSDVHRPTEVEAEKCDAQTSIVTLCCCHQIPPMDHFMFTLSKTCL